jgi:hypothetical protein
MRTPTFGAAEPGAPKRGTSEKIAHNWSAAIINLDLGGEAGTIV